MAASTTIPAPMGGKPVSRRARSPRTWTARSVVRDIKGPEVGYGVVEEVKHLLAGWAATADAVVRAVLLAVMDRVGSRRRIDRPHPPAVHEVPRREDFNDRILAVSPEEARRRAVSPSPHLDGLAVAMRLGAPPARRVGCKHAVSESEGPATLCRQGAGRE